MSKYPPQFGYDSRFTQKIANNFPDWHVIRTDQTSTGFKFLNAYGMGLGDIEHDINTNRRNFYLSTADTLVRWDAYRMQVPQGMEFGRNSSRNLLLNSHLQFTGMAVKNQPREWEISSGTRYTTKSFKGTSMRFSPEPGETAYMYQDIEQEWEDGDTLTASVYANDTGSYSESEFGAPYLSLQLSAYTYEGGVATQTTLESLSDISGWERYSVTLPITNDAYMVRFAIRVVYPDSGGSGESEIADHISFFTYGALGEPPNLLDTLGAFSYGVFTDGATLPATYTIVSAPQLEYGNTPTEWKPSPSDTIGHSLRMVADYGEGVSPRWLELIEVSDPWDILEDCLPTRVETSLEITGDVVFYNSGPVFYEWSNEFWSTAFRVTGDVVQLYNTDINNEVLTSWSIYDRYIDNVSSTTGEFGIPDDVTRTLEALTVFRKNLYVVCKEVYEEETKRVLKVLEWAGIDDRLQVITDVDMGFTSGDVQTVGFIEGHMDRLGLTFSDDAEATAQLYYDYFYHDMNMRQIITRQEYADATVKLIEV